MDAAEIGQIIRDHRQQAGLTLKELASLAGVGKTTVFDLEKGRDSVRIATLLRLLSILNIRMELISPLLNQ